MTCFFSAQKDYPFRHPRRIHQTLNVPCPRRIAVALVGAGTFARKAAAETLMWRWHSRGVVVVADRTYGRKPSFGAMKLQ